MSTSQKKLINVSFPYDSVLDDSNLLIKLELELQYLISDCVYVHKALAIYIKYSKMPKSSEYSDYYDTVNEALVYRIIHGLSKLFDNDREARSINKINNKIASINLFNSQKQITIITEKIKNFVTQFQANYNLRELRDTFFGHLDEKNVLSSLRKSLKLNYTDDLQEDIFEITNNLVELYNLCFPDYNGNPMILIPHEVMVPN